MCTVLFDETEVQVQAVREDAKDSAVDPLMMMHAQVISKNPDAAEQIPLSPAFLSNTKAQTLWAGLCSRLPPMRAMAAECRLFWVFCMMSDAARACGGVANIAIHQVQLLVPFCMVIHQVCLMHQLNLAVCAMVLPTKILNSLFCGALLLQKGSHLASLRKQYKHAIYAKRKTFSCQAMSVLSCMCPVAFPSVVVVSPSII